MILISSEGDLHVYSSLAVRIVLTIQSHFNPRSLDKWNRLVKESLASLSGEWHDLCRSATFEPLLIFVPRLSVGIRFAMSTHLIGTYRLSNHYTILIF